MRANQIMAANKIVKKVIIIIIGSIIAAYGLTLAMYAGFGGPTLGVFWMGLSNVTGLGVGIISFMVAFFMMVFSFFYDRKQINFGTLIYQIVYSYFIDVFSTMHVYSKNMIINFFLMCLGIFIYSIGTGIYASTNWGRGAYDAVNFAIADRNNLKIGIVRIVLDIIMIILGAILGGKWGLCSIMTMLMSGPLIQMSLKKVNEIKNKYGIEY